MLYYQPPLTTLENVDLTFPWARKLWKVKQIPYRGHMVKQKTVHDGNTRKDASVTLHGYSQLSPNEQWEVNINPDMPNKNDGIGAFEPKRSKDRPSTHKKINDTDH